MDMADAVQIKLVLENEKLTKQLKDTERKFSKLEQSAKKSASSISNAFTSAFNTIGSFSAVALPAVLLTSVVNVSKAVADLNDQAQSLGVSFKNFQVLQYAAIQSGTSIDKLTGAIAKMQVALGNAQESAYGAETEFSKLGLSIYDLIGLSPDEQFIAISQALAKIEDPTKRAAIASDIFGKSFRELVPLMKAAEGGMAEFEAEAIRAGAVIDDLTKEKMAKFDDAWESLKIRLTVFKTNALTPLVDYLNGAFSLAMDDKLSKVSLLISGFNAFNPVLGMVATAAVGANAVKPKVDNSAAEARDLRIAAYKKEYEDEQTTFDNLQKHLLENERKTAKEVKSIHEQSTKDYKLQNGEKVNAFREASDKIKDIQQQQNNDLNDFWQEQKTNYLDILADMGAAASSASATAGDNVAQNSRDTENMLMNVASIAGDTFMSIASGAESAGEAVKALAIELAKAVVKALILMAINGKSFGSNLGYVFGGASPTGSQPQVRVFNYAAQAGGVQTRANGSGGVDVIIGQITNAINRGGNPLDQALRRSYGLGRAGA